MSASLTEEDFFPRYFGGFPIEPSKLNIAAVRSFCLARWQERHVEMKRGADDLPHDLTDACKFTALFGSVVFGAQIAGNWHHVFNLDDDGEVIDIAAGSDDVQAMLDPYLIDRDFITSEDFFLSLKTCVPRITEWIEAFAKECVPSVSTDPWP